MTTAALLVGGLLVVGLVVTAITHWAQGINDRIETMVTEALAIEADDWNEPAYTEAEWDARIDKAIRMSETPIHDQLARHRFEVEALAEIDEMTGGIA